MEMEEASASQYFGDVEDPRESVLPVPENAAAQELANIFAEPSSYQPDGLFSFHFFPFF